MKRTLIIALAISFSSLLTASPFSHNIGCNDKRESTFAGIKEITNHCFLTGIQTEDKTNNTINNQTDKPEKSSVNEKKVSSEKENKDGNYRDMQRGRKVLEHKYNLYA